MTKEEKQLLLIDLCSRLPWGVNGKVETIDANGEKIEDEGVCNSVFIDEYNTEYICIESAEYELDDFKPYLRPLSSMSEEEMGEYAKFKLSFDSTYEFTDFKATGKGFINVHTSCKYGGCGYTFQVNNKTMLYDGIIGIDWLNKKHFDYRGLIPKGLAIKASEEMYNF